MTMKLKKQQNIMWLLDQNEKDLIPDYKPVEATAIDFH